MRRALPVVGALVGLQALLVIAWLVIEHGRSSASSERRGKEPLGSVASGPGSEAPDFDFISADGSPARLSDLRGRPMVLHFWATWCPPCRKELPSLLELARDNSLVVVAVSLDKEWRDVRLFLGREPDSHIVLARSPAQVRSRYRVRSLPITFLVDRRGRLRRRIEGPRDWSTAKLLRAVRTSLR